MSGALGYYAAANLLNYGTTSLENKDGKGKWLWENDPGYRLTPQIAPGVFWSSMSPGDIRPARDFGVQTAANTQSLAAGAKDIPRNVVNELLGTIPLLNPIFQLAGKSPYLTTRGDLGTGGADTANPVSTGQTLVGAGIQRMQGRPDATPWGQAAAKDVASLGGQRVRFETPHQEKLGTHLGQLAAEARAADPMTFKAPQTPEERQTKQAEDALIADVRAGKPGAKEAVKALPNTAQQKSVTERAAYTDDNAHAILTQPLPALATAYQKMTPAERAQPAHAINAGTAKFASTKTPTYKEAVLRRFDEAIAAEKVDAARARLKLQKDWLSKLP